MRGILYTPAPHNSVEYRKGDAEQPIIFPTVRMAKGNVVSLTGDEVGASPTVLPSILYDKTSDKIRFSLRFYNSLGERQRR